jgi:hypothetical protein
MCACKCQVQMVAKFMVPEMAEFHSPNDLSSKCHRFKLNWLPSMQMYNTICTHMEINIKIISLPHKTINSAYLFKFTVQFYLAKLLGFTIVILFN